MPRGGKRPGSGRPLGAKNKRKIPLGELIMTARSACTKANHDPFIELIRLASDPNATVSDQVRINIALTGFLQPQLRAVEHSGLDPTALTVTLNLDPYGSPPPLPGEIVEVETPAALPAPPSGFTWERIEDDDPQAA